MKFCRYDCPAGTLILAGGPQGLTWISWEMPPFSPLEEDPNDPLLLTAKEQLDQYFAGARRAFDLPLAPQGTPFQQAVWAALRTIPYGETRSYLEIARQVGNPKACRAVGMANHRNPLAIVVPCHRVVGAGGQLTGYAGGLDVKRRLLDLEAQRA